MVRNLGRRTGRAVRFTRAQGIARLIEEKELDPWSRAKASIAGWRWRRANAVEAGAAVPVWVVGLQRSGTNLLVRCLGGAPEVEVCSENDRRAFRAYRVRSDSHLARVRSASRHRFVVFKPLCDSHRVASWLDEMGGPPGRAVWVFRSLEGRTLSALAKFGDAGRRALCDIAAGRGDHHWQAQGLSAESHRVLRRFDLERMSPASGAALLWYVRNMVYFELGLHHRDDVRLLGYEDLLDNPNATMRELARFIDLPYRESLVDSVEARRPPMRAELDIDGGVRTLCDGLTVRLRSALGSQNTTRRD